jgi:hypothetical protein
MRRRAMVPAAVILLAGASLLWAQRIWVGGGRFPQARPKWATRADFTGSFNFCRVFYTSNRGEPGGSGWNTDYPGADNNFSVRLAELTVVPVMLDEAGQPNNVVVQLSDPLLFQCPVLFMEDVGTIHFRDVEIENLRAYLLKGGFLLADDFWGTAAWVQWAEEIGRVLPRGEFPIVDIPAGHPIMRTLYDVKQIEQVSSIQFWSRNGGAVSERGADSAEVHFRGIADQRGRLMVVMAHNTDIPDTWEREGENKDYFDRFSPAGYAIGVNNVVYGLTH